MVFIPLYPKLPLFSPIEEYIVRVRLEDLFVLIAGLWWLWLVIRGKLEWKFRVWKLVGGYVGVGLLSLLSAVFLIGTIPLVEVHVLKSLLHYFRYIEYFSVLFVLFSVTKTKRDLRILLGLLAGVVVLSSVYGVGQKYWKWPVYSTMNREYSKGVRLVIDSPHARIQSTFAGHYDYGAYLVIALPIVLAWAILSKDRKLSTGLWGVFLVGVWGLVMSASRSAVGGFLVGIGVVGLASVLVEKKKWSERVKLFIRREVVIYGLVGVMLVLFGANVRALFMHTLEGVPGFDQVVALIDRGDSTVIDQFTNPVPAAEEQKPPDVYVDHLEKIEVVRVNEDGETVVSIEEREPVFSECAQQKGLSLCIRLEALWPKAWEGFLRNPLLGSGYATLNKTDKYHLAQADSTDNNYLRILGETGLLGLFSFMGVVLWSGWMAWKLMFKVKGEGLVLAVGFLGTMVGLLINALYIDVFVASKVAFGFWMVVGMLMAVEKV